MKPWCDARRSALTMVELLAAVSLLSVVAVAISTWVVAQTRQSWEARQRLQKVAVFADLVRLLEDDVALSATMPEVARVRVADATTCVIATRHAAPGDRRGLARTRWHYAREQDRLWREREGEPPRPLAAGLQDCGFRWLPAAMAVEFSMGLEGQRLVAIIPAENRP